MAPMPSCLTKNRIKNWALTDGLRISRVMPRVNNMAMGSLVADSNSMVVSAFSFSLSFLDSRMEKTAAASVEDTTAPSRIDSSRLSPVTRNMK